MLPDSKMNNKFEFGKDISPNSKIIFLQDDSVGWFEQKLHSLNVVLTDELVELLKFHNITQFFKGHDENKIHDKILFFNEDDRDLAKYLI